MTHRLTWLPPGSQQAIAIDYPTYEAADYQAQRISATYGGIEVAITPAEEHT